LRTLTATRVLSGALRGSSRPVVAETAAGPRLVKLRGAAQGTGSLVAEIIVAALAEALDLRVPPRDLVLLPAGTPTDDRDQELGDLLRDSVGVNLGFALLPRARDVSAQDLAAVAPATAAAVLWLDRLVLNPDRTPSNPNLLLSDGELFLIDQGAALRFQYDWSAVTEQSPGQSGHGGQAHVFEAATASADWPLWDELFARRLARDVLEAAVAAVPDDFLEPLLRERRAAAFIPAPDGAPALAEQLRRRRAAYVAFLWKRLQPPRLFARANRGSGSPGLTID